MASAKARPAVISAGAEEPAAAAGIAAQNIAQTTFPTLFGGLELTGHGTHVVIYLTRLSPVAERDIIGRARPSEFTFVKTRASLASLTQLQSRISHDWASLQAAGINIVSLAVRNAGRLEVTIQHLTPAKARILDNRYGAANLDLRSTTQRYGGTPLNRTNDTAPWNGGDFITDKTTGDCTSGFGAHSGTTQYMITAEHCYSFGEKIYNGAVTQGIGSLHTMGTIAALDTANNGYDAEVFNTSSYGGSSKLVYAGSSTNPTRDAVSGATTAPKGYQVCSDGAFEGEICSLVQQLMTSGCISEPGRMVCGIWEAFNSAVRIAAGEGDSGGPVFRFEGSALYGVGIITAGAGTQTTCPTYQKQPGRLCFQILLYTDLGKILSDSHLPHLTLNT